MANETPRGNGRKKNAHKTRRKTLIIICIVLAVLLVLLAALLVYSAVNRRDTISNAADEWFDPSAELGNLPGRTQEEIQAELNKIVEKGMFNISIASIIVFPDGESEGQARIENIEANPYHMSVVITLDDTGETLYESKGIKPGQYIEYITLSRALEKGEYNATALFTAYEQENYTKVGQAAAKIKLVVEN